MLATDDLSEAHERERQQYRQEIDSLTRAVDKARHDSLTQLKLRRSPSVSHAMLDPACATGAGAPPPRLGETPLSQRDKSSPPSLPRDYLPPLAPPPATWCGNNTA